MPILNTRPYLLHKPRNNLSAVVWYYHKNNVSAILKQVPYNRRGSLWGLLSGCFLKHEKKILEIIANRRLEISPKFIRNSLYGLELEYLEGKSFFQLGIRLKGQVDIFEKLNQTVTALHNAGVAHGEIRCGNILFSKNKVYLIDFATSITRVNPLFSLWKLYDRLSLVWIKRNVFCLDFSKSEGGILFNMALNLFSNYFAANIPYS